MSERRRTPWRPRPWTFPKWPRWRAIRWFRRLVMSHAILPMTWIAYGIRVEGRARLDAIDEPCLIVSNHNMHLDQSILLRAMPIGFRQRVAIAAAASDIYGNRVRGFFASLLGNAFPFSKQGGGVRESLEYVAKMLDDGWNVLIFPEGRLTVVGPMKPFKRGVGLLARETGVQVLPIRIDVLRPGFYEGKWLPHPRASVRVTFGEPVRVPAGLSHDDATRLLEDAVREAGAPAAPA